ncbi:MAG: NAD(P)/FAD-dependent oxidoreductase [Anaerolineaceae bacterium]|nr:NAD(P)/FAD-dependent oxidoreductase [Anaerolineaceae bacterium]
MEQTRSRPGTFDNMGVAVIGAGIGGLAAAYDLAKAGKLVTIYESADHVGGLASGIKENYWDWSVERYYHHWFASDEHMLRLIEELGWSDKVIFPKPKTVVFYKGKYYPFDSILAALLYPGLGWGINKIRFGLVGLFLRLTKNWKTLEKVTADSWMRKWAGDKVYESMWEPMMIGKFGEKYARQVNMAWLWARLHARTTRLGTFEGGFQNFADQFANTLRAMGVQIYLNTPIETLKNVENGKIQVDLQTGSKQIFDQVLVTLSPGAFAKLSPDLPESYLNGLLSLKSMGAVVMVLALDHQLSPEGYYWYNIPKVVGYPFLSLVEHTNYVPSDKFGGDHIIYIGDYLEPDHEHFQMSKEELLNRFLPHLAKINPAFKPEWVKQSWLSRTAYAQPIPFTNHSKNIPEIKTPVRGLFFASMSQVYPWDRGTNFAVEIGRRAAGLILND